MAAGTKDQPKLDEQPTADTPELTAEQQQLLAPVYEALGELHKLVAGEDPEPDPDAPEPTIAQRAAAIRNADEEYVASGLITTRLLQQLYPLLVEPIPAHLIETLPATTGKPYESTGIKSVQTQIDRMNDVLGLGGWRSLYHYIDGGQVCKSVVVVGTELHWCRLDDQGNLLPYTVVDGEVNYANVLLQREGWGGHSRGNNRGDLYKGAETNSLKRTLARVGPGCEVYRLDFEDHPEMGGDGGQSRAQAAQQAQQRQQQQDQRRAAMPDRNEAAEDWPAALAALLAQEDEHADLRKRCAEGMEVLGAGTRQQVLELRKATSKRQLDELWTRINAAVNQLQGE